MNTIIHDITYACPKTVASPLGGSICLASPDLGRFWGGSDPPSCLFPSGLLFILILDLFCLLDVFSPDLVGPIALSCVHYYRPVMVVVVISTVIVVVFVNVIAVVVLGLGRPPYGPLTPCHPPNGENTNGWDLTADNESDQNYRSQSWVIRKSKMLMEKSIVDGGNDEKKPLSSERKKLALEG